MRSMPGWGGGARGGNTGYPMRGVMSGAGNVHSAVFSPRVPADQAMRAPSRVPGDQATRAPSRVRVADQSGHRERGARAAGTWQGAVEGAPAVRHYGGASYGGFGDGYGNGYGNGGSGGNARGGGNPITPVSAETRQVPHPPADSPVRAGSIREDVARYNEERAAFRPLQRGGGDVPRPPMPSPYRN